jgi:hypothetical protein
MKNRIPSIGIATILILMGIACPAPADSPKTQYLEQKSYEISSLRAKMIDKVDQALEMKVRLELQLSALQDEIRSEQASAGIYSHQEAMQNLRIRYNLLLVQVLLAYIEQLNERIGYFESGNEHLKFLIDQINDDIALIHTLKDMKTDHLTERINRVLDEYGPETKKPVFNTDNIRKMPIQQVWEQTGTGPQLNSESTTTCKAGGLNFWP